MTTNTRIATKSDAQFVHDVYGYYVEHTDITFSTVNPSIEAYGEKIEKTLEFYPFFILEADGVPCGFTYAGKFRPHEAYQWTAEGTICLAPDAPKRRGLGSALYGKLLEALKVQGMQNVFGVITTTNEASIRLHLGLGFENVGRFRRLGNKSGKWLDVVWMQKTLNDLPDSPKPPVPFPDSMKAAD